MIGGVIGGLTAGGGGIGEGREEKGGALVGGDGVGVSVGDPDKQVIGGMIG